jgi:hypothetical protein
MRGGHDAVMDYWIHISDTSIGDKDNPNSLAYKCDRFGGFGGALAYWGHTLTEEACDLLRIADGDKKIIYTHMRHCPSRGMLNSLSHVEPYYDYCTHCKVIYQRVLEKYGIVYERDHSNIDMAECRDILYEAGEKPDIDYGKISDAEARAIFGDRATVIDLKTEDNKYLHRDFHLLGDNAIKYCAEKYGKGAEVEFLEEFTRGYFAPIIDRVRAEGLSAIEEWLFHIYDVEEASQLIHTELSENKLSVRIDRSPVIEYMHTLGKEPSEDYIEETRTVYRVIAEESGFGFELLRYDADGAAEYIFYK